jgi:hypothetical protein
MSRDRVRRIEAFDALCERVSTGSRRSDPSN